jgi:hypothetical protein
MKRMKAECPMCEATYYYIDMRNIPPTCGSRICEANYKYQQKTWDPRTGRAKSAEEIKKW